MNLFNYICPGCGTIYQDVVVNGLTKLRHAKLKSIRDKSKLPTSQCVPYHDYVVFDPCGHCCPEVFVECRACKLDYPGAMDRPGQATRRICECHYCLPDTNNFQILEEAIVQERTIIIDEQEFMLDNSDGPGQLETEKKISNSVANTFSIGENYEVHKSIGAEFAAITAEIGTKVSRALQTSVDKTNTIENTLKFSVPPKKKVKYIVIWKRKERTGIFNVSANSDDRVVIHEIPYKIIYDLNYDIRSVNLATED